MDDRSAIAAGFSTIKMLEVSLAHTSRPVRQPPKLFNNLRKHTTDHARKILRIAMSVFLIRIDFRQFRRQTDD